MGFQQGLSGLNTSAKALDVVGNNIANSNTVGFKTARAEFADVFAASLAGGGASQVGVGAQLANIAQQFTQGNITTTNNPLDMAINGGGFYQLSNNGAVSFSRNGQFQLDKTGYIVNANGYRLQGYAADFSVDPAGIIVPSTPTDLFIDPSDLQPKATDLLTMGLNLDSRKDIPASGHTNFDINDPLSYTASTSVTLYDTLGNPHVMSMYFTKAFSAGPPVAAIPKSWDMRVALDSVYPGKNYDTDGDGINDFTPVGMFDLGAGADQPIRITFDTGGKLSTITDTAGNPILDPLTGTPVTSTLNASIDIAQAMTALGKANSAASPLPFDINVSALTQFGSPFGVTQLTQTGFSSGRLSGLNVSADGVIQGRYSNGQARNMGQVVLAKFNNPNGLLSMGGNQWQETSESGQPLIGAPATGSNGVIQSAAVEEANVDLTAELVNMITQQRAYQANAQTIKTQDSILQTLVNLR